MNEGFLKYLVYIISVACILMTAFLFTIFRRGSRNKKAAVKEPIKGGSASVFFDKTGNVTIIPYIKDKYGAGRAMRDVRLIEYPYTAEYLGHTVKSAMKMCSGAEPCSHTELMAALKYKGWKDFSEGRRNISIHYLEQHGVVFNTTSRKADGSYHFNCAGFDKVMTGDETDRELGEAMLILLKNCRC